MRKSKNLYWVQKRELVVKTRAIILKSHWILGHSIIKFSLIKDLIQKQQTSPIPLTTRLG